MLDPAALQITREREANQPRTPLRLLPELLRNALASLALTLGFAALARRPGQPRTLLQEGNGHPRGNHSIQAESGQPYYD